MEFRRLLAALESVMTQAYALLPCTWKVFFITVHGCGQERFEDARAAVEHAGGEVTRTAFIVPVFEWAASGEANAESRTLTRKADVVREVRVG